MSWPDPRHITKAQATYLRGIVAEQARIGFAVRKGCPLFYQVRRKHSVCEYIVRRYLEEGRVYEIRITAWGARQVGMEALYRLGRDPVST